MDNSTLLKKAIKKGLRVLYFDIETSPFLVWTYGLWNTNIACGNIDRDSQVTSIAYRFEGPNEKTKVLEWDWSGKDGGDDTSMLVEFSSILDQADVVVAQNGDRFDLPVLNWRMNVLELQAPNPSITLDTLKLSRKVFKAPSHKLDYRSKVYGFGGKIKQDMEDCIAVAKGCIKTQRERVRYNIKDTDDLRNILWREIDAYTLPKSILKMLKEYTAEKRPFCIKCAAGRQRRFQVSYVRIKKQKKLQCDNCNFVWNIPKVKGAK